MSNSSNQANGGIGFAGLLTIAFIVLKLTEVIKWSWVWVLSPLWIVTALVIIVCILVFAWFVFEELIDTKKRRRKRTVR